MLVNVYSKEGQIVGEIELRDDIFGIEPNEHVMHLAVVAFLANQRQGTHKTKIRSEVSGGGKKPWRQKGRGTARAGSIRSPLWVHGGTIHGPKPRSYSMRLTKKMRMLARKSALSLRMSEGNIIILEDFILEKPKTKEFYQVLNNLNITESKTLVLLPPPALTIKGNESEQMLNRAELIKNYYLSARNIDKVSLFYSDKVSTYQILNHKKIVIFKSAVDSIQSTFTN
ncbi:MAG: 50S ribosomal protein L4 [Candidatus Kapaibacteriales bacterium]